MPLMRERRLVFDVGCHAGDDTAYYLRKGYDVVAIEANPELVLRCRERFSSDLASGRVRLLNACVSDVREELTFYVNENDGWSSFFHKLGKRGGKFRELRMLTVPFDEVVAEFGVPHFMKMDVEGAEPKLLRALHRTADRPAMIGLEIDFYEGDPIEDLRCLGYDRFRFVRQPNEERDPELPEWQFGRCSSGPLPRMTDSEVDNALGARRKLDAINAQSYRWHDLYAVSATRPNP
jgi:FkbM family methyltransferase